MSALNEPIYVTKPSLPPLEKFNEYLQNIWASKCVTNAGPYHEELEQALCSYLGVKYVSLFSNGTLALMTALQVLEITGEVITTPFSFVATSHALRWNNINPVFSDIEPYTFNLDHEKIESLITPQTTAILPVHVYGNPCNMEKIEQIAREHKLKVIYDACHCFGVSVRDKPILNFGDLSILSFHGTKVFNTFEGGAIVSHSEAIKKKIDQLKNFGFVDETTVELPGINAKMNEFQAALGLLQLKYVDEAIEKRKTVAHLYRKNLINIPGLSFLNDIPDVRHCYSYFPILIDRNQFGKSRDDVYHELKKNNIYSRRYFYPLISQFHTYREMDSALPGKMPVAEKVAEEVLCLPIYPDLELQHVDYITNLLKKLNTGLES